MANGFSLVLPPALANALAAARGVLDSRARIDEAIATAQDVLETLQQKRDHALKRLEAEEADLALMLAEQALGDAGGGVAEPPRAGSKETIRELDSAIESQQARIRGLKVLRVKAENELLELPGRLAEARSEFVAEQIAALSAQYMKAAEKFAAVVMETYAVLLALDAVGPFGDTAIYSVLPGGRFERLVRCDGDHLKRDPHAHGVYGQVAAITSQIQHVKWSAERVAADREARTNEERRRAKANQVTVI